jgi:transketolase N-terminal domain/subunit
MSEDKKPVSIDELILSNTFSISAIMNVLEKKGLVTREEVIAEVDRLKREMDEKVKKN